MEGLLRLFTQVFYRKAILKNFVKLIGKHLIKLQVYSLQFYQKRDSDTGFFLLIYEMFKNTFFTGHLRASASVEFQFTQSSQTLINVLNPIFSHTLAISQDTNNSYYYYHFISF